MEKKLQAGFARMDISPRTLSVPLAGLGATEYRLSGRIVDPLYAHCIALSDGEENCLIIAVDLVGVRTAPVAYYRAAIREATGLREDRIYISATHTHAGPDLLSPLPNAIQYRDVILRDLLVEGAERALADLKPTKLSYGAGLAGRPGMWLNFDRHYLGVEESKKDNWKEEDLVNAVGGVRTKMFKGDGYVPIRHCEEVDHSIQVLRFAREAADDILLVNFAAHATFTESKLCPDVSSDFPGAMVECVEKLYPGTKCAYLQGCCGNAVGSTIIEEEGLWQITMPQEGRNYHAYGAALAGAVQKLIKEGLRESETDTLSFLQRIHMGTCDHSKDEFAPKAKEALKIYEKEGHTHAAVEWCRQFHLGNIYGCSAILRKAALPEKGEIELNAIRIGDCALVTIPFEPYSSVGEQIKAGSGYPVTFVCGYCCGQNGYLPNKKVHPESYEGRVTNYVLGTAEEVADVLGEMLKKLK